MYSLCIWRCEHARFCVEDFFFMSYVINFHSFIHSSFIIKPIDLKKPGNTDHRINDVADDVETCLQMAPFLVVFRSSESRLRRTYRRVFNVCRAPAQS